VTLTFGDRSIMYKFLSKGSRIFLLLVTFLFLQEEGSTAWARGLEPPQRTNVLAERAFAEAERLRAEWNERSLRAAIDKYKEALLYWRADNNKPKEAQAVQKIGEVCSLFGESKDALAHFKQALKLSRTVKDIPLQIETLNNLCSIYAFQGETTRALNYCNEALLISRQSGDRRGAGQALNNTGEAYYYLDLKKALSSFEQALALLKEVEDRRGQAHTLTNIGYIYTDWSHLQEALSYYNQALTLWPATGDLSGEARTINALGVLHSKLGEKQKAVTEHSRARELFRTIGNRPGELTAFTGIGYVYDSMGEKEKALDQYVAALEISRAVGQREAELVLLVHVGNVYDALGRKDEALAAYREALILSRVLGDLRMQAYTLSFIGQIHDASGSFKEALSYYKRALSLSRRSEDKRGEASVLNHIGHVYERSGQKELALEHYKSALALHLVTRDRDGEAWTRYNMAGAYHEREDLEEARHQIETSLQIIESLRTRVGNHELRLSYFASVQQYYYRYIDILMQMHKSRPADGLEAAAFQASGRARARNLLDLLLEARADVYESIDPGLREKENTLRRTLNAKSERQMRLLGGRHSEEEAAQLEKEISDLTFELEDVRAQIREKSPRYAALTEPQPLSLRNVQEMLDEDTLLLEYALGEKRSYLWAVTKTGINTYELPERAKIEETARRLYGLLSARSFRNDESLAQYESRVQRMDEEYWEQAVELGKMILGPVRWQLETKRLLIVADGALLLIPFGALAVSTHSATPDNSDQPLPLILEHEIISLPSASTLAILRNMTAHRQPATKAVAVLADPVFERNDPRLGPTATANSEVDHSGIYSRTEDVSLMDTGSGIARLLASGEEAEAVLKMAPRGRGLKALGFEANLDRVRDPELAQYRIVHFATHGIFNSEHPELSGVILSLYDQRGQPRAGFLRLHEIYNLNLPVELVVLSACNTGLGKRVRGEGLIGLTRGFMYAGAAGVMSSLWKVDDDATAELMKYFYEAVFKDGLPPAAALRKAQIRMWQIKRRRSPYYWAGFVLYGEYQQRPLIDSPEPGRRLIAVGVWILLASSLGFYLLRLRKLAAAK
jgi:CHAT domain-containing protein/tetratricopeptide (TPR) repeat protein